MVILGERIGYFLPHGLFLEDGVIGFAPRKKPYDLH
jgi:hypothetical protein